MPLTALLQPGCFSWVYSSCSLSAFSQGMAHRCPARCCSWVPELFHKEQFLRETRQEGNQRNTRVLVPSTTRVTDQQLILFFTLQEPSHPLIGVRPQGRGMSCGPAAGRRSSSHAHQCVRGGWSPTNPAPGWQLLPWIPCWRCRCLWTQGCLSAQPNIPLPRGRSALVTEAQGSRRAKAFL